MSPIRSSDSGSSWSSSVSSDYSLMTNVSASELTPNEQAEETTVSTIAGLIGATRDFFENLLSKSRMAWEGFATAKTYVYTTMASSLTGLCASIITLYNQRQNLLMKGLLISSIVLNLTSIFQSFKIISEFGIGDGLQFSVENATALLTKLSNSVQNLGEDPNQNIANAGFSGLIDWIRLAVSLLVVCTFTGFGVSGLLKWGSIKDSTMIIEGMKKTWKTVGEITDWLCVSVLQMGTEKDLLVIEEMEQLSVRVAQLSMMDPAEFVLSDDLYQELIDIERKIRHITSKPVSADASRRLTVVRALIQQHCSRIHDKLVAIEAIRKTAPRQCTIGVVFSGDPGVGKSQLAQHAMRIVSKRLGYNERMYCLNRKKDGFWEPYGAQALGIYNEFMAYREDDQILPDLNLIVSEDPMNFESAHLEGKSQPCRLKMLSLTTNVEDPPFERVMHITAAQAVWDRLFHIHVSDPKFNGRQAYNPHRKPDYSHLKLTHVKHYVSDNSLKKAKQEKRVEDCAITLADFYGQLTGRVASAEKQYLQKILAENPPEDLTIINNRLTQLNELIRMYPPFGTVANVAPTADHGRDFFVWRFQGVVGSGKTTIAKKLCDFAKEQFTLPCCFATRIEEFDPSPDRAMIYVLDDVLNPSTYQEFVYRMNATHPSSVFLITTNETFFRVKRSIAARALYALAGNNIAIPWDASDFKGPEAVLRRIGLEGFVQTPQGLCNTGNFYTKTYTFEENMVARRTWDRGITNYDEIENDFYRSYVSFLAVGGGIAIVNQEPPIVVNPGIQVEAESEQQLLKCLQSTVQMAKAFSGMHKHVKVHVDPEMAAQQSGQTMYKTWMIPETSIEDPGARRSLLSRLFASLNRLSPGVSVVISIDKGSRRYVLAEGRGYFHEPDVDIDLCQISYDKDKAHIKYLGNTYVVTAGQFAAAACYNQFDEVTRKLPKLLYRQLRFKFSGSDPKHIPSPEFTSVMKIEEARKGQVVLTKNSGLYLSLIKHPVICALGALAFGFSAGYLLIKLVRIIGNYFDKQEPTSSNSHWYDGAGDPSFPKPKPPKPNTHPLEDPRHPRVSKQAALLKGQTWIRSNTHPAVEPSNKMVQKTMRAMGKGAFSKIRANISEIASENPHDSLDREPLCPTEAARKVVDMVAAGEVPVENVEQAHEDSELFRDAWANMLRVEAELNTPSTDLERMSRELNKYYYQIRSPRGANYAIAIADKYLLTVAHAIDEPDDLYEIFDGLNYYKCTPVLIARERELAVVQVLDKAFQAQPNIARKFVDQGDMEHITYGFYVRPLETSYSFMGSYVSYHPHLDVPVTCQNSPVYKMSDHAVAFTMWSDQSLLQVIHRGDCGFPLLTLTTSGYRIMGIHNAYNTVERRAWFSGVTKQDIQDILLQLRSSVANTGFDSRLQCIEVPLAPRPFMVQPRYASALENLQPSRYEHYSGELEIMGYSQTLNFISRPTFRKVCVRPDDAILPLESLPAAVDLQYVTDDTALARDDRGYPDPLFTQLLKYKRTPELTYNREILDHVIDMTVTEQLAAYGKSRRLRLYEVVNGMRNKTCKAIDLKTAAGPYMKLVYKIQTKAPLFRISEQENSQRTIVIADTPAGRDLRQQYEDILEAWENGYPYLVLSKDCAKVELLPRDKAEKGKVRLFNELDLSLNMALKTIFGDHLSRVMEHHYDNPIKIGMNPYTHSTRMYNDFREIPGDIIATDYSAFDKTIPAVLIRAFTTVASRLIDIKPGMSEQQHRDMFEAIADTLTYVLHTCRGTLAMVDRGNESGSFITTLFNSDVNDINFKYAVCEAYLEQFGYLPSLAEFTLITRRAIFGDDMVSKVSPVLNFSYEHLEKAASKFGMCCTVSKGAGDTAIFDFCSRTLAFDEKAAVVYPQLKRTSITGCLFWVTASRRNEVLENVNNALLEASMHDRKFYDHVEHDAFLILRRFRIHPREITLLGYDLLRSRFADHVRNGGDMPALSLAYERNAIIDSQSVYPENIILLQREATKGKGSKKQSLAELLEALQKLQDISLQDKTEGQNKEMSSKGRFLELLQKSHLEGEVPEEQFERAGPVHAPTFTCTINWRTVSVSGTAASKKAAMGIAYKQLLPQAVEILRVNHANIGEKVPRTESCDIEGEFIRISISHQLRLAAEISARYDNPEAGVVVIADVYPGNLVHKVSEGIRYQSDPDTGELYVRSAAADGVGFQKMLPQYMAHPCTFVSGSTVRFGATNTVANVGETGIEPSQVAQANDNPGITTVPALPNPIPTNVQPAMAANEPAVVAATEVAPAQDLVPVGPPNMMRFGAIGFDLKDLVYSQFLDTDIQYTFTDDTPEGTILFQIPYDPTSSFMNSYAKRYVSSHTRYTGSLLYRVTIVGNQTYSGLIGVSWYPKRINQARGTISELQKYSYYAESITLPSNRVLPLHDARQEKFYRLTTDKDIDNRPHLVVYVMMSAVSPLKTGISIRLRVASKLASLGDMQLYGVQPFQASDPTLEGIPIDPSPGPGSPFIGMNFAEFLGIDPQARDLYVGAWRMGTDGTIAASIAARSPVTAFTWDTRLYNYCYSVANRHTLKAIVDGWLPQPFFGPIEDTQLNDKGWKWDAKQAYCAFFNGEFYRGPNTIFSDLFKGGNLDNVKYLSLAKIQQLIAGKVNDANFKNKYGIKAVYRTVKNKLAASWWFYCDSPKTGNGTWSNNTKYDFVILTQYGSVKVQVCEGTIGNVADPPAGLDKDSYFAGVVDNARVRQLSNVQIKQIAEVVAIPDKPSYLPQGWRNLIVTNDSFPTTPGANRQITILNSIQFSQRVTTVFKSFQPDQCLQIRLADTDSQRNVCTFRYYPTTGYCVLNSPPEQENISYYTLFDRELDKLYLAEVAVVTVSSEFYVTDFQNWSSRATGSALSDFQQRYEADEESVTIANWAEIVGGAIAGLGSGLGAWQQHQNALQIQQGWLQGNMAMATGWQMHQKWLAKFNAETQAALLDQQQVLAGYRTPAANKGLVNLDEGSQTGPQSRSGGSQTGPQQTPKSTQVEPQSKRPGFGTPGVKYPNFEQGEPMGGTLVPGRSTNPFDGMTRNPYEAPIFRKQNPFLDSTNPFEGMKHNPYADGAYPSYNPFLNSHLPDFSNASTQTLTGRQEIPTQTEFSTLGNISQGSQAKPITRDFGTGSTLETYSRGNQSSPPFMSASTQTGGRQFDAETQTNSRFQHTYWNFTPAQVSSMGTQVKPASANKVAQAKPFRGVVSTQTEPNPVGMKSMSSSSYLGATKPAAH